jgi:hypothetical protein
MSFDQFPTPVRRVVLVVLDGLRPDAVQRFELAQFARLARLARLGAATFGAIPPSDRGLDVSLTDIPATILWSLGIPQPDSYVGKPLAQAFAALRVAA